MNRRFMFLGLIGLIILLTVGIAPALAAPGAAESPPMTVITPEQAARLLLNALTAIVLGAFGNAPITLFLVSVIKRFVPAEYGAGIIQFLVGLGLTVVFWLAQYFGYEMQFRSAVDFILLAGPALLAFISTLTASSAYYHAAKAQGVPVLGYSRE